MGDVGFLTERDGVEMLDFYPGRTNGGGVARHTGWLGTTNNVSRSAMGCWRIVGMASSGWISIERLSDADADKYLAAWLRANEGQDSDMSFQNKARFKMVDAKTDEVIYGLDDICIEHAFLLQTGSIGVARVLEVGRSALCVRDPSIKIVRTK